MPYLVLIDDVTKDVLREYTGASTADNPPGGVDATPGATWIDVTEKAAAYGTLANARVDDKGAIIQKPAPPERVRLVTTGRFYDLFTPEQRAAIFARQDGGDPVVRDLWMRVQLGDAINLLSPRVAAGLGYLTRLEVFGKDPALADAEIARILAGRLP